MSAMIDPGRALDPRLVEAAEDLPFLKVTGGGNDFVLIDNRGGRLRGDLAEFVRLVCHRGLGVGADGLILIEWPPRERSGAADLRMIYFNRDGGEADLCGNALRCVAYWAARSGSFPRRMRVQTGAGILTADGGADPPWFTLPLGRIAPERVILGVEDRRVEGTRVRAGVPHLVIEVKDAFAPGVLDDAPALRSHPDLGPEGANVDYFTPRGGGSVDVRFFERGVEAETLSSGSGSIAVAVAAVRLEKATSPVTTRNREGLTSRVTLEGGSEGSSATLAAEVRVLYHGRLRRGILP